VSRGACDGFAGLPNKHINPMPLTQRVAVGALYPQADFWPGGFLRRHGAGYAKVVQRLIFVTSPVSFIKKFVLS